MLNFVLIGCYLLLGPEIFLCIVLDYKKLKFEHLIVDIIIGLWFSRNLASMMDIRRKYSLMVDLSKLKSN